MSILAGESSIVGRGTRRAFLKGLGATGATLSSRNRSARHSNNRGNLRSRFRHSS
jgi:hypothetical protein